MTKQFRVFATCDIGESIELLRRRGYQVEVYPQPEAPPKSLIVEKVKSGIDGLITTLRDSIDAEIFAAGQGTLKVVAQFAVFPMGLMERKMWPTRQLLRENRGRYCHPYQPVLGDEVTRKTIAIIET